MSADPASDFDHSGIPDSHPALKRHVFHSAGAQGLAGKKKGGR